MRLFVPRRPWHRRPAVVTAAFAAVLLGGLWYTGLLTIPGFGPTAPDRRGLVAIPVSAQRIPRYTRITRDHFWDAQNKRLTVIYLPPAQVPKAMYVDMRQILGRVLDHDKQPGYAFTEDDFLPPGTRPGLVAGIPAGKRAVRVDADKVAGIFGLQPGDRFDLISALPLDTGRGQAQGFGNVGGVYGKQLDLQARLSNWQKQATVEVLVQNGIVVEPMITRQVPVFARSLTQGAVTRTRPIQEIVIAVDPHEVAGLLEALAVDADLSCIPRSGRPDDPMTSRTPGQLPRSPFSLPAVADGSIGGGAAAASSLAMIETINGTKRDMVAAPSRK